MGFGFTVETATATGIMQMAYKQTAQHLSLSCTNIDWNKADRLFSLAFEKWRVHNNHMQLAVVVWTGCQTG